MKLSVFSACLVFLSGIASATAGGLVMTNPIYGGRWGNQSPAVHPRYIAYTQYGLDVYVPQNQGTRHAVRWSSYTNPYYDEGFKAQVVGIYDSCSSANAGKTVILRVFNSSNQRVAELAYSHLDSVQVALWSWHNWYSIPVLGYTRRWGYSSCYTVRDDNATHVHMEWGGWSPYSATANTGGYAAYQTIAWDVGSIFN